ncbi:MAG: GerMN domain-containing protein [Firmicutes bacterium]|nr:GerMN domain-containing protein [Bacillota bacterium]
MKIPKLCALCVLCVLPLLLSACSLLDDLKLFKTGEETAPEETVVEDELTVTDPAATGSGPAADDSADDPAAGPSANAADSAAGSGAAATADDARRVVLYFADAAGQLTPEERELPPQEGIARATVNELIAGPQSAALSPTLPASAIVEGMTVKDGLCTVDFSSELVDHLSADEQDRRLAVYSIVNTLTQFDTVERVRILVDGAPVSGSFGGLDLSAALAPAQL